VTFRARLTAASAAAVAMAIVSASLVVWFAVRAELRGQVDDSLRQRVDQLAALRVVGGGNLPIVGDPAIDVDPFEIPADRLSELPPVTVGEPIVYVQLVSAEGDVLVVPGQGPFRLEPTDDDIAVARGASEGFLADRRAGDVAWRVYTTPASDGIAAVFARPLTEVSDALGRLALVLTGVTVLGVAAAIGLGMVVTRTAARPVAELTAAAERVTETGDLSHRIDVPGADDADELGRLASSFNAMLGALDASVTAQRRLVADASHELRTPLTSVRTNLDVLARHHLAPDERAAVLADVQEQLEELTVLVHDLVDLARDGDAPLVFEDVRLDEVAAAIVDRARRRANGVAIAMELTPSVVRGDRERIGRAVGNLLDNAVKFGGDGAIDVTVRDGTLVVRDRGPGVGADDLPRVFDRFYRSASARAVPGSGLGLAIVHQVAAAHGGSVTAETPDDGGFRVTLALPVTS